MRAHRGPSSTIAQPKPWDLLLVSAAALILISVARLHSFVPGLAAIRPGLIVTIVALVALAIGHKGTRSIRHLRNPLGKAMAFFVIWAVVGAPFGIYIGNSVKFLMDQFLREAIVIVAIAAAVRDLHDLKRLLAVFGIGVVVFAMLAQGAGERAVGGGGYDANDSAMFIVSGFPLIFYFMTRAKALWARILFGLGLLSCGSVIVLSGSRGGFIALVVVLAYALLFMRGMGKVTRLAIVGAAATVIMVQADSEFWDRIRSITDEEDYNRTSYTGRVEVWKRGVTYMMDHPVFGVGINNFSVAEGWNPETEAMLALGMGVKFSVAHSIWIQVAAEMGIPGILGLMAMLGRAIQGLWSAGIPPGRRERIGVRPDLDEIRNLSRPLIGVLIAAAVAGSFLSRAYSSLLWLPLALALALLKVDRLTQRELGATGRAPLASPRRVPGGFTPPGGIAAAR